MFTSPLLLWKGFHNIVTSVFFSHLLVFRMHYMALCGVFAVLEEASNNVEETNVFSFFAAYVLSIMFLPL